MDLKVLEDKATDLVCGSLSEEDAARYRTLMSKEAGDLTEEEAKFLRDAESRSLRRSLAFRALLKGTPDGCTCNAGCASHRHFCPLYGQDSVATQVARLKY
jgi:hypothetical protein